MDTADEQRRIWSATFPQCDGWPQTARGLAKLGIARGGEERGCDRCRGGDCGLLAPIDTSAFDVTLTVIPPDLHSTK